MDRWTVAAVAVVVILLVAGPFLTLDNQLAAGLFGLITTTIGTAAGIWAGRTATKRSEREELTRYGLQAYRHMDALSVKVQQKVADGSASVGTLESWLLDIDQAKLGWQDLLREVFELQKRLQLEQDEISLKYKKKMESVSPDQKDQLEEERRIEIAKLAAKAPLPLKSKCRVDCPNCGAPTETVIGDSVGDTAHAECDNCHAFFPIHRQADGEVHASAGATRLPVKTECAHCKKEKTLKVLNRHVKFIQECYHCGQMTEYEGDSFGLITKPK